MNETLHPKTGSPLFKIISKCKGFSFPTGQDNSNPRQPRGARYVASRARGETGGRGRGGGAAAADADGCQAAGHAEEEARVSAVPATTGFAAGAGIVYCFTK